MYVFNAWFASKNRLVVDINNPTVVSATVSVKTSGVYPKRMPYFFNAVKST